jgi:rhamnulokinase
LGASSGRVVAGRFHSDQVTLEEIHRFENGPVPLGQHLHWDLPRLWSDILDGLQAAADRYGRQIASIGVDTWGVDYGLLTASGELVGHPVHYRDARTSGMIERAEQIVSREEIFAETGLQFMQFNTLFQLLAEKLSGSRMLEIADSMLMMPDLFHWLLTGERSNELTNATTTQLYNPLRGDWSETLIDRFELPRQIFGPLAQPGTDLGPLRGEVASRTGLQGVRVVLPGTHDTASAVAAVPAESGSSEKPDWCYISSGTWSLMGLELPRPVVTPQCAAYNFTNEGGVGGTTRLLKNITGLWLLQKCRRAWQREGRDYSWEELNRLADEAAPLVSLINPDDGRFLAPEDMPQAIREACRQSGQPLPESEGAVVRCALESLALKCRQVLGWLEELSGSQVRTIHIVGGGTKNKALCQMTADACGRTVVAGPAEGTALGNLMVQAIAGGDVGSLAQARALVRRSLPLAQYDPRPDDRWDEALARFEKISPPPGAHG